MILGMELRTVRYFLAVVDAGTVTAAADEVRVTQPALSRQVRQLERDLGVALFERTSGRLALSPAGRALVPFARELLSSADAVRTAARLQAEGRLAQVSVAAPITTLTDVLAPFIATFDAADPTPEVFASDGLDVTAALQRGADLVITNRRPRPPLEVLPLAVLPVWAYLHAEDRWAGRSRVALVDLLDRDLITLPPSYTARQSLDAAVWRSEATPRSLLEASSGPLAQALAAARRGVAVVSDDSRYGLHGCLISDGRDLLSVTLFVAWNPDHPARSTLRGLAERLHDYVVRRYGESPDSWRPG